MHTYIHTYIGIIYIYICALYHHISPDTVNGLFLAPQNSPMSGVDGHWPQCVFLGRHVFAENQLGDVKPTYDIISYTYTSWGPQL